MTPLSDALTAAQRHALATLEKAYVAGAIEADPMGEAMEACGITDAVDRAFLVASLDVLKEWGVAAPTMSERVARENGEPEKASDKQTALIATLCKRRNQPAPDERVFGEPAAAREKLRYVEARRCTCGSEHPGKWGTRWKHKAPCPRAGRKF